MRTHERPKPEILRASLGHRISGVDAFSNVQSGLVLMEEIMHQFFFGG